MCLQTFGNQPFIDIQANTDSATVDSTKAAGSKTRNKERDSTSTPTRTNTRETSKWTSGGASESTSSRTDTSIKATGKTTRKTDRGHSPSAPVNQKYTLPNWDLSTIIKRSFGATKGPIQIWVSNYCICTSISYVLSILSTQTPHFPKIFSTLIVISKTFYQPNIPQIAPKKIQNRKLYPTNIRVNIPKLIRPVSQTLPITHPNSRRQVHRIVERRLPKRNRSYGIPQRRRL